LGIVEHTILRCSAEQGRDGPIGRRVASASGQRTVAGRPLGYLEKIESQKTSPPLGVRDHFKAVTAVSISRGTETSRAVERCVSVFERAAWNLGKAGSLLIQFYLDILVKSPYYHP
jgi:hypothetical protein